MDGLTVRRIVPQLRTTALAQTIDFYTAKLGFTLEFQYHDFYAGVRHGESLVHLKQVDAPDPSIAYVTSGDHLHLYLETPDVASAAAMLKSRGVHLVVDVHDTAWQTRECVVVDDQGHTLYFGQALG